MRILWVKAGKLLPVDTGGKIRSYNILRQLTRNHDVALLSYYSGLRDANYETEIQREFPGTQTIYTGNTDASFARESLHYIARVFESAPFAVSKHTHRIVQEAVETRLGKDQFDVAVCDFLAASGNFPRRLPIPTVLFQHNVESILWQRMASTETSPIKRLAYRIEAGKMLRYERAALRRFHHIIAVSEIDRRGMLLMDSACAISVIPTGVDTRKFTVAPPATVNPPRIVFVGSMDWEPNIDAVSYFVQDIFPGIRAQFPSAVFEVVGRTPPARVKQLASGSVIVTGTVPSVNEYLQRATVVVVPLRIGGGTRLKIFEAMATGKAVVSTSIGAEGLEVKSGRDLVLADDAPTFAEAIALLLGDSALRRRYEEAAAKLAAQFDWSNIGQRFAEILQGVISQAAQSRQADSRAAT